MNPLWSNAQSKYLLPPVLNDNLFHSETKVGLPLPMLNRLNLSNYNGRTLQISLNNGAIFIICPILDKMRHHRESAALWSCRIELMI